MLRGALLAGTALTGLPAAAAEFNWTVTGGYWADSGSWDNGVPGAGDTAIFALGDSDPFFAHMVMIEGAVEVGLIRFAAAAQYYWLNVNNGVLTVGDIDNLSAVQQTIYAGAPVTVTGSVTGDVAFEGPSILTFSGSADSGPAAIKIGGVVTYKDHARAGTSTIGVTNTLVFTDEADADEATITLNSGTISLEGDATAGSSEITVKAGMLVFSGDATAGSATLRNDASVFGFRTIQFSDTSSAGDATIYSGRSGNGSSSVAFIEQSSAGTARLIAEQGGRITFSDTSDGADAEFVLDGGTIGIDMSWDNGDFTAGSLEGDGTVNIRNKVFVVGSNGLSTTYDGVIDGTGSVSKVGSGRLTLTSSAHGYTGLTTVAGGTLIVNGDLQNSLGVVVMPGARLGGTGKLPTLGINGGTLAPGNSIGQLTVVGDLEFAPGSIYEVEVDDAGHADRTMVTGTATLGGGVSVLAASGSYAASTTYTILTAGTIVGSFASVTTDLAFLTPTLSTAGSDVILTLTRNAAALPSIAGTPNQAAAASGVDALGAGNPIKDAITGLSVNGARAAYDGLSGEVHASLAGLLVTDDTVRRVMAGRLQQEAAGLGAFLVTEGGVLRAAADGNAASAMRLDGEILAGLDAAAPEGRLGLVVHGGAGNTTIADRASSATDLSYGAGLYGATGGDGLGFGFGLDYTGYSIETERHVAFGGIDQTLRARYAAQRLQGFGELSYKLHLGTASVAPFANLAMARLTSGGFAESSGDAALQSGGGVVEASFATLGLRASADLGDGATRLRGLAGWRKTLVDPASAGLAFAGGTAFTISGPALAGDAAVLEGGLDMALGESLGLAVSYDGQLGATGQSHAIKASLGGSF